MDVLAVEDAARRAVALVRSGGGPAFLELRTYRFRPHSMYDPELYRTKDEVEAWKAHDPIDGLVRRLADAGSVDERALEALEAEVAAEIEEAVAFADSGSDEPIAELERFVYMDTVGASEAAVAGESETR
jgi:TPP-dependent pyruvate/acetoin dehydrogenase alpha subunit